jgi:hypothetical protein
LQVEEATLAPRFALQIFNFVTFQRSCDGIQEVQLNRGCHPHRA